MHVCDVSYNYVGIMILFISQIREVMICDIKIIGDTHHQLYACLRMCVNDMQATMT